MGRRCLQLKAPDLRTGSPGFWRRPLLWPQTWARPGCQGIAKVLPEARWPASLPTWPRSWDNPQPSVVGQQHEGRGLATKAATKSRDLTALGHQPFSGTVPGHPNHHTEGPVLSTSQPAAVGPPTCEAAFAPCNHCLIGGSSLLTASPTHAPAQTCRWWTVVVPRPHWALRRHDRPQQQRGYRGEGRKVVLRQGAQKRQPLLCWSP